MERIHLGTKLRDYEDVSARPDIKVRLFEQLPLTLSFTEGLPTVDEWLALAFQKFRASDQPNKEFLLFIARAESLYIYIKAHYPEAYLLHGDLRHENILRDANSGWIAIDPKGAVGPKIMECGRFLQNFIEDEVPNVQSLSEATDE